jgi:abequosyltransferase
LALALSRTRPVAYIAKPLIEARSGIQPDFGAAQKERAVHVPGSYSAKARIAMWAGLIRITQAVCLEEEGAQLQSLRDMLDRRYYFHVAEMVSKRGRAELASLFQGLHALGLMRRPIAIAIHCVAVLLGQRAGIVFSLVRRRRGRL